MRAVREVLLGAEPPVKLTQRALSALIEERQDAETQRRRDAETQRRRDAETQRRKCIPVAH